MGPTPSPGPVSTYEPRLRGFSLGGVGTDQSLSYQISATASGASGAITSITKTVKQDELDTIREEYIELDAGHGVPGRGRFAPRDEPYNDEDYSNAVVNAAFDAALSYQRRVALEPASVWMRDGLPDSAASDQDLHGGRYRDREEILGRRGNHGAPTGFRSRALAMRGRESVFTVASATFTSSCAIEYDRSLQRNPPMTRLIARCARYARPMTRLK